MNAIIFDQLNSDLLELHQKVSNLGELLENLREFAVYVIRKRQTVDIKIEVINIT